MKQLLLIFLLIPVFSIAQKGGEIKFWVQDAITGDTIKNASAFLIQPDSLNGKIIPQNEKGRFILKPLPAGMYSVSISAPGYETEIIRGIPVSEMKTTYLNPRLKPVPDSPLPEKKRIRKKNKINGRQAA